MVGMITSIMGVGIAVGKIVGRGVNIDSTVRGVPAQAVRMNKRAGMIFFNVYIVGATRQELSIVHSSNVFLMT